MDERLFQEDRLRQLLHGWGIQPTTIKLLYGEFDLNYQIVTDRGNWVLKLRRSTHAGAESFVAMQAELLQYLERASLQTAVPKIHRDTQGRCYQKTTAVDQSQWWAWVLTYLDGDLLDSVSEYSESLLHSLGYAVGEVDQALYGFQHPYASRPLLWNSLGVMQHQPLVATISDPQQRSLAATGFGYLETIVPAIAKLPRSVIHNDGGNQHNMLVCEQDHQLRVHGMIDFGDAILSPRLCGLGTAIAYAGFHAPLETAVTWVTRGYETVSPLNNTERELLFATSLARWLTTVSVAAARAAKDPADKYAVISAEPAWRCLTAASEHEFSRQAAIVNRWIR